MKKPKQKSQKTNLINSSNKRGVSAPLFEPNQYQSMENIIDWYSLYKHYPLTIKHIYVLYHGIEDNAVPEFKENSFDMASSLDASFHEIMEEVIDKQFYDQHLLFDYLDAHGINCGCYPVFEDGNRMTFSATCFDRRMGERIVLTDILTRKEAYEKSLTLGMKANEAMIIDLLVKLKTKK